MTLNKGVIIILILLPCILCFISKNTNKDVLKKDFTQ